MESAGAAVSTTPPPPTPLSFCSARVQDAFQLDGANVTLLSGSIHYHRVHPSLWRDRLSRLRALGLNAIQTYVPWNFHQSKRGVTDLSSPARNISDFFAAAKGS